MSFLTYLNRGFLCTNPMMNFIPNIGVSLKRNCLDVEGACADPKAVCSFESYLAPWKVCMCPTDYYLKDGACSKFTFSR